MGQSFNLILDVITIAAGIYIIVTPNGAYNWGRRHEHGDPPKIPKNWHITARIIGVAAILAGGLFLYLDVFS